MEAGNLRVKPKSGVLSLKLPTLDFHDFNSFLLLRPVAAVVVAGG